MVLLFWTSVGFCEGRRGIGVSETTAQSVFVSLPSVPDRVDRVEGVLADFWSGSAPRARGLLRAERLQVAGRWHPFPAEVFLFVSGTLPVERRADRGDRVSLVGRLKREDLPASSRDVALPWTRYRMSVKSALEVRRTGRTALSLFSIPNLFFHRALDFSSGVSPLMPLLFMSLTFFCWAFFRLQRLRLPEGDPAPAVSQASRESGATPSCSSRSFSSFSSGARTPPRFERES